MGGHLLVLVLLLVLFLHFQPSFQSQGLVQANPYGYSYGYRGDNSKAGLLPYGRGLSYPETSAFSIVISNLGLNPAPSISRSFCDANIPLTSIIIRCICYETVCHISEIYLQNVGLKGIISGFITELKQLEILDLSNNQIHGSIPDNLGVLSNLQKLDLSNNQLSGRIPKSLGELKKLTSLHLSLNLLDEKIPETLGSLPSLVELHLWSNKLTGSIPRELGQLSQLKTMEIDDNELTGELPPELGNLSNLERFWATSNSFNGNLSERYANLKSLKIFAVGGNRLSGTIPPFIAKWENLTLLNLMGNNFEGNLPPEILNMTKLQNLWVSDLISSGFPFPESANLTNINSLILRHCSITGTIPKYIGNWSELVLLDLSFNNLTGGIPDSFQNLSLSKMFLTGNKLDGTIPVWLNKVVRYKGDLSYNNFENGTSPKEHELRKKQISLSYSNSIYLKVPNPEINTEPANRAYINQKMEKLCQGKKSKYHDLFINAGGEETTIGRYRYDADNTVSNFHIDSSNKWAYSCSGDFMSSTANSSDYIKKITCGVSALEAPLYEKARLCPQSLTYYGFCLQNGNYTVKLHFAETTYTNDEDQSSKGKRVFDIYVQGKRVYQDFNLKERANGSKNVWTENFTAYVYKNQLEIGLFWAGKGSIYNTPGLNGPLISAITVTHDFKVGGLPFAVIVVIIVASIFIPLLLLAIMWIMGWLGNKELQETRVELRGKSYTVKQVINATRNFSPKMEIGRGRFGTVYKAVLPDQTTVAVKKLAPQSKQVINQIESEVYTLKTLKHPNLVELLDVYSKRDLHMLIYEYMEHSSLGQAIFGSNSDPALKWVTRVNICLGIAKGLKYLHEGLRLKIVHRNIKATNILLDGDLVAKVSDFGLAQLCEEENSYAVVGAGGTLVYMAPEYATRKAITDKVDVYSFGIVLLEIVSGKSNADYKANQETVYLMDTACVLQSQGKLQSLIDEKLEAYDREQALTILKLAMMCIDQSPSLRPTMSEVVSVLEGGKKLEEISNKVATPSA